MLRIGFQRRFSRCKPRRDEQVRYDHGLYRIWSPSLEHFFLENVAPWDCLPLVLPIGCLWPEPACEVSWRCAHHIQQQSSWSHEEADEGFSELWMWRRSRDATEDPAIISRPGYQPGHLPAAVRAKPANRPICMSSCQLLIIYMQFGSENLH